MDQKDHPISDLRRYQVNMKETNEVISFYLDK